MDRTRRAAFMTVLPLVYNHLVSAPDLSDTPPELVALAVNLTQDRQLAEVRARLLPIAENVVFMEGCGWVLRDSVWDVNFQP